MEIEHLTKTQIVLLTLLVGFVTSIATGIVTVSLLDQAPKTVTQTINRVVEHTVERVVPAEKLTGDELIADSVEKNQKSIVKIYAPFDGASAIDTFFGYGVFISKDGIIMTDAGVAVGFTSVGVVLPDGTRASADRLATKSSKNIHLYRVSIPGKESTPVKFANSDAVKLGQSVIGIGGDGKKDAVAVGVITSIVTESGTLATRTRIETSLDEKNPGTGRMLFALTGELVGFHGATQANDPKNIYVPINLLKPEMELLPPTPIVPVPPVVTPEATSTATTTGETATTTPATEATSTPSNPSP